MTIAERSILEELHVATGTSVSLPFQDRGSGRLSLCVNRNVFRFTESEFLNWKVFAARCELPSGLKEPPAWDQLARTALQCVRII